MNKMTPWGMSQSAKQLAPEIWEYDTPSHGGFHVTGRAHAQIPQAWRDYAAQWSHGFGSTWFEEDVACMGVLLTFPDLFPHIDAAGWESIKKTAAHYGLPADIATQPALI